MNNSSDYYLLIAILVGFLLVLIAGLAWSKTVCYSKARVISHYDGDTFKVQLDTGRVETIRIADIDAPERKPPPGKRGKGQPWAMESRTTLKAIMPVGSMVNLNCSTTRSWGRLPCYVDKEGQDIGQKMVESGFAFSVKGHYDTQEIQARTVKEGMWKNPPMTPKEYRDSF